MSAGRVVAGLSASARRAILEAMVAMAWADARLEREEIMAIQAAGRVLELPDDVLDALDAGPPAVEAIAHDDLEPTERELVFLCAAWMSSVDSHEDGGEEGLLRELAERLEIPAKEATRLRDDARTLHVSVPSSMPWWEELSTLIERASDRLR